MTRAIELAWRGWGRVSPNPMVGAVLLQDGRIVGEGWHAEFGQRHAEPVALEAAGSGTRGSEPARSGWRGAAARVRRRGGVWVAGGGGRGAERHLSRVAARCVASV